MAEVDTHTLVGAVGRGKFEVPVGTTTCVLEAGKRKLVEEDSRRILVVAGINSAEPVVARSTLLGGVGRCVFLTVADRCNLLEGDSRPQRFQPSDI